MILLKGFISGLLTLIYLIVDSWWWIFALAFFIGCAILESKEIVGNIEDDKRDIL